MRLASLFSSVVVLLWAGDLFSQDMPLSQVLLPEEDWELVSEGHQFTEAPAVDAAGDVYFADVPESKIFKIDHAAGKASVWVDNTERISGLMFGADGRLYGCSMKSQEVTAYTVDDKQRHVIAEGVPGNDLVVARNGHIYVTDPRGGQLWLVDAKTGDKKVVANHLRPNGVILWPNEGTLVVTDNLEPVLWTFRVEEDGSLKFRERYYGPLQMASGQDKPGSDGMTVDSAGRLYVASHAGLQMFDPTGRLGGAIAKPQRKFLSNVVLAGPDRDTLYTTCHDKVYRRKTKVKGVKR